MVFAQPDHDGDRRHKREALTKLGGESDSVGDVEIATLLGHEHPAVPKSVEDTVHVDGTFERRVVPRVDAANESRPVRIPFRTYALEGGKPSGGSFGMKFILGETVFPSIPVALFDEV